MSGVESVDGGPPIDPVAGIGRDALAARDVDESRDKSVIADAVHAGWETHHGHSHSALDEGGGEQLSRDTAGWVSRRIRQYILGGYLTRCAPPSSGRDDKRPAGAGQRLGHDLDGAPVCRCGVRPADTEIVVVGGVNNAVRSRRSPA